MAHRGRAPDDPVVDALVDLCRIPSGEHPDGDGHRATWSPGDHPVTVATWCLVEDDGRLILGLDAGRARLRHLRDDPRVSLTALAEGDRYTHVSVQGRVVEITDVEIARFHGWGGTRSVTQPEPQAQADPGGTRMTR